MRQVVKLLAILFSLLIVNSCSTTGQFREIRAKAIEGDPVYQYNLGVLYDTGDGVSQDYGEAVKWYRKAIEQGYSNAQNNLGVLYENGQGVPQDYVQAVELYRKAAENDNATAQNNLGLMYRHGKGVTQDYGEAARWFKKAAEQGHTKAQDNLIVIRKIEVYRTAVSKRDDQIKKIERYEIGKTTLSQFIDDGWNSSDPYNGRWGIVGYSIKRNENYKPKTSIELPKFDEAKIILSYSPYIVYEGQILGIYQRNINTFVSAIKGQNTVVYDRVDPPQISPIPITREELNRMGGIPKGESGFSEYFVFIFRNDILYRRIIEKAK
jgi:hypothetical protein